MTRVLFGWVVLAVAFVAACLGQAVPGGPAPARRPAFTGAAATKPAEKFLTEVPAHAVDVILGRPTDRSIAVSVLFYADTLAYLAYGASPESLVHHTPVRVYRAGEPGVTVLDALAPATRYHYQVRAATGDRAVAAGQFVTQRPPGSTFTFTIQADSHLDEQTDPAIYRQSLAHALADGPDFHIDLGDTFMTEKHAARDSAAKQYLAQRYYFGLIGASAPVFLVLGNHDGEDCRQYDGTPGCLAVWSNLLRQRYFPNPVPDAFYTGNQIREPTAGLLQDYYAWTWGDALFVVLDPFWYSSRPHGRDDNWARSLGGEQYRWLARTLANSQSHYKFVFIHHLVGGLDNQARGGVEAAPLYEWGGRNADGTDGFRAHRPGWDAPIHALLVRQHVTAVFHGHDHFYARQELDGIVYQLVPQPSHAGPDRPRNAEQYGYRRGDITGGSGYLRVTVSPAKATVDYVASGLLAEGGSQRYGGRVVRSWSVGAEAGVREGPR